MNPFLDNQEDFDDFPDDGDGFMFEGEAYDEEDEMASESAFSSGNTFQHQQLAYVSSNLPNTLSTQDTLTELAKWENIRKAQSERGQDHESFYSELEMSQDGFSSVATYFGKTNVTG